MESTHPKKIEIYNHNSLLEKLIGCYRNLNFKLMLEITSGLLAANWLLAVDFSQASTVLHQCLKSTQYIYCFFFNYVINSFYITFYQDFCKLWNEKKISFFTNLPKILLDGRKKKTDFLQQNLPSVLPVKYGTLILL